MSALGVEETGIPGVLVLTPRVFADARGAFFESWNEAAFAAATGVIAPVRPTETKMSRTFVEAWRAGYL